MFDGQFRDGAAARGPSGVHDRVHQGGSGQQRHAGDHVVGQPRLGGHRDAAGEHQAARSRKRDDGAEQRMLGRVQPQRGRVGATPRSIQ